MQNTHTHTQCKKRAHTQTHVTHGPAKVRVSGVRAGKVRSSEVGASEVWASQVRMSEVGASGR